MANDENEIPIEQSSACSLEASGAESPLCADARDASFRCSEEAARLLDAKGKAVSAAKQHKRERVALGVFGALVLAGFIVLTSYIANAGHGLNVAATNIDDMAGDMSGYDVMLFEGTAAKSVSNERGASPVGGPFDLLASDEDKESMAEDELVDESSQTADSAGEEAMTVEQARAVYEAKKASVIEIDPDSLRDYASGRIIMKDGHSYGIFSLMPDMVPEYSMSKTVTTKTTTTITGDSEQDAESVEEHTTTRVKRSYNSVSDLFADLDSESVDPVLQGYIADVLDRFEAAHVDTVVALTSDPRPFAEVEGVDAVITFKTQECFPMSEVIGETLYFDAPEIGSVGVLMVAPGNVASTKVLTGKEA